MYRFIAGRIKDRKMDEYKVIFPKDVIINSRKDRDRHDNALEVLLQEILKEQERSFRKMREKGIR